MKIKLNFVIHFRPQTKAADEGSSTELECRFVAIPEAEVQWFHNKAELREEKGRVEIIHQADMHMYCRYARIFSRLLMKFYVHKGLIIR